MMRASLKTLFLITATAALTSTFSAKAQQPADNHVRTPNYALAERFSQKRIGQMVFSTTVQPHRFRDGYRFFYSWKTSDGIQYYLADPKAGKVTPLFDLEKLAMQITEIVKEDRKSVV